MMFTDDELVCVEHNAYYDYDFYDLTDCQYYICTKGSDENANKI